MSENDLTRGVPVTRRVRRPPHPSPSPPPSPATRRRSSRQVPRRLSKSLRPIEIFTRSNSEPALWRAGAGGAGGRGEFGQRSLTSPEAEGVLYRPQTCADLFLEENTLLPRSPQKSLEGYNKDAKVVVNVTVEGSPGPIRAMVKLGSSVQETIKLVVDKYGEEGRIPHIDKDATSTFELHHSYFSLQSLNNADAIGDAGSRNFYLRRTGNGRSNNVSLNSDNLSDDLGTHQPSSLLVCFQSFICGKITIFIRKMRMLWKILACMNCS